MSGLGLLLSDNIHTKENSQSLWFFSFLFLIWDFKEDNLPVCARGVRMSCSGVFAEEQSCGFYKELSSPTCLWVVHLNKHFHRKRQDICLKQEEEKIKTFWAVHILFSSPAAPSDNCLPVLQKKQTSSRPVRL